MVSHIHQFIVYNLSIMIYIYIFFYEGLSKVSKLLNVLNLIDNFS